MMITIICPGEAKSVSAGGRTVFTAPELSDTAERFFFDVGKFLKTDLLRELSEIPTIQWRLGLGMANESVKTVKTRAAALAKLLLSQEKTCIVFSPPVFLPFLLRALERRGCNIRRSGSGPIQPGERIRVTEKKDHCGGCQHNCLLSSPGCGVGKDKASRGY